MKYANIILPFYMADYYTYGVPIDMQDDIKIGMRVEVQFGKSKIYSGVVFELHNNKPETYIIKPILSIVDTEPILQPIHLKFWKWISSYYMCKLGEVMNATLPAFLKLNSETVFVVNNELPINEMQLNDAETIIINSLVTKEAMLLDEIQKLSTEINARKVVNKLLQKGYLFSYENVKENYKPKTENYIGLHDDFDNEEALNELFIKLEKSPKQLHLMLSFLHLVGNNNQVQQQELLDKASATPAALKALIDKNILTQTKVKKDRVLLQVDSEIEAFILSNAQAKALTEIQNSFAQNKPALLFGVTGSGKTNVHIKLIQSLLNNNKQVLYLLPEIALTTQVINKLLNVFGQDVSVYHSRYTNQERVELWQNAKSGKAKVIVGARSALFLPFVSLGAVIVDEEHDASYKQLDPAPRYHARDAAIVLANLFNAPILLSSGTPSVDSYYNAANGKYNLVSLQERFGNAVMPKIYFLDNNTLPTVTRMSPLFTNTMLEKISSTVNNNKQVILFQNRRGFAPYLFCGICGWNAKCTNCDVALSYHKQSDKLHCHYCGSRTKEIKLCPVCKSTKLYFKNYGTERVEEEVKKIFPNASVDRLDLDTANTKNKYKNVIRNVEKNITDILIGTQMVVKGLDFEHVQLVGVISVDSLFTLTDYRVNERAFQTLTQISGRAGRVDDKGEVYMQVSNKANPYLPLIMNYDYKGFYLQEIEQRKQFNYPPFCRLIKITVKHKDINIANAHVDAIGNSLKEITNAQIIGPAEPPVARVNNQYIKELIIKCPNNATQLNSIKEYINKVITFYSAQKKYILSRVILEVDA
jgi:primosomal protein N' (replication factor Y) (superfamily II helicase)